MVLVSIAWAWQVKDLARRWPSVASGLAPALLERLERDPQLLRDVKARELAVLDSLRLRQWVLPKRLEPGEARLSAGAGGDTLAAWVSLSALWQGGLDSVLKDPDVLTRADEEASRASIERLAGEVRPSREDRLLAALFLGLDRVADAGLAPTKARVLRRMVEARVLRERFMPGRWTSMVEMRRQARGRAQFREALCWRVLDGLARSWGVPDSGLGEIRALAETEGLAAALERARPQDPVWLGLLQETLRYRELEVAPAPELPEEFPGKTALETDTALMRHVWARLAQWGYARGDTALEDSVPGPITGALLAQLRYNRGQRLSGGWDDTLWGELVRPDFEVRIRLCSALVALTRAPWRRDSFCVRVNVPEFALEVIERGRSVQRHRVAVGRDSVGFFTPVLSSRLNYVVVNPQWHVPAKILREEILGGKAPDEALLRAKGYEPKFGKQGEITGAYQPSGEENALGKVKFLFDNRFGVYLHDTPSRHLFARTRRAFSHGCVRVQEPLDLADLLLARDGSRFRGKLDSLVEEENQKWIKLVRPVPLHLEYRTVALDSLGRVSLLRDVYGLARERARLEKERERAEKRAVRLSEGRGCSPSSPCRSLPGTGTKAR